MTTQDKRNKRKQYFIDKRFQLKFVLKFCLILLLGVVISTSLLLFFSQDTLTSSFDHSKLRITNTAVAILPSVIFTNLITLALITMATIFVTVVVSHRIAGPLFRFEKEMKTIGQGDLTKKVVLRSHDQVSAVADAMNHMVSALHGKVVVIQKEAKSIRHSLAERKTPGDIIQAIDNLQDRIEGSFRL